MATEATGATTIPSATITPSAHHRLRIIDVHHPAKLDRGPYPKDSTVTKAGRVTV